MDDMVCMKCGLTWKAVYPKQKKQCPAGHKNVASVQKVNELIKKAETK